jgi:E3 ubiquitin-protein ligase CHFR
MVEKDKPVSVRLATMNATTAPDVEVSVVLENGSPVLSVGRSDTNTCKLPDQRVSYKHFLLRARMRAAPEDKENEDRSTHTCPGLELVDLSTNGTWVNNYRVGKGKIVPVSPGDEIQILPVTKVGRAQMIGYTLHSDDLLGQGEEAPSGVLERPKWVSTQADQRAIGGSPQFKKSGLLELGVVKTTAKDDSHTAFADDLEQEVTCGICADIFHKSVALVPCLHNFCTACYLEWRHRSNDCPNCRGQAATILRNHAIDGVVNTFLKAHPSRKRDPAELNSMDKKEDDPLNRLLLSRLLNRRAVDVLRPRREHVPIQHQQAQRGDTRSSAVCALQ